MSTFARLSLLSSRKSFYTSPHYYAAVVFIAGACYGAQASMVKLAYHAGFTFGEITFSQVFFGLVFFCMIALLQLGVEKIQKRLAPQSRRVLNTLDPQEKKLVSPSLTPKGVAKLIASGVVTCCTALFYYKALETIPASIGITLLFQFTWIGVVLDIILRRKFPKPTVIAAVIVIFAGTLAASGVFSASVESLDPLGVVFGLISAVCCAGFMHLSGTVETHIPANKRSIFISLGACLTAIWFCPDYFVSGALGQGLWFYGLMLSGIGFVIPIFLFAYATPQLTTGISTIMASSELPVSVLCSVIILHEWVDPLQIFGIALILGGVALSQLRR